MIYSNSSFYHFPLSQNYTKECLHKPKLINISQNELFTSKIKKLGFQKKFLTCKNTSKFESSEKSITSEIDDSKGITYLENACGKYILKSSDIKIFTRFKKAMSSTIIWILILSFLSIARLANIIILKKFKLLYLFGASFRSIQSLAIASIFIFARQSFTNVISKAHQHENSLPNIIDGIQKLSVGFQYLAFIAGVVTFLFTMEASASCPDVVLPFSIFLVVIAILRFISLVFIQMKYKAGSGGVLHLASAIQRGTAAAEGYPWLHRMALRLSLNNILTYSFLSKENYEVSGSEEYEFSEFEENIVRVFIDSMRIASIAYLFQSLANFIKGLAALMTKEYKSIIDTTIDLCETSFTSILFLSAAVIFDKILTTHGEDISNLLDGFDTGLTRLFFHLSKLFRSVCIAIIIGMALRYVNLAAIVETVKK